MKQATLVQRQQAARGNAMRLQYIDEVGLCGSPLGQRSWSPRRLPHEIKPNHHCRRSVIGAMDFGSNTHAPCHPSVHGQRPAYRALRR